MATSTPVMASIDAFIYLVRGKRVILDADMARIYGVPTKRPNEQVRRNRNRFPEDFAFQITLEEFAQLRIGSVPLSAQDIEGKENSGNRSQFATGSARRRSRA